MVRVAAKKDPNKTGIIRVTSKIPTETYNEIIDAIDKSAITLEGPLTVSEFILKSAEYCLANNVFDTDATFKLPGS